MLRHVTNNMEALLRDRSLNTGRGLQNGRKGQVTLYSYKKGGGVGTKGFSHAEAGRAHKVSGSFNINTNVLIMLKAGVAKGVHPFTRVRHERFYTLS